MECVRALGNVRKSGHQLYAACILYTRGEKAGSEGGRERERVRREEDASVVRVTLAE